jgi:hypothetical protein
LALLLGFVALGTTLLVAGVVVLPASADLIFGAQDGAGNCIAHVPPIPAATCDSGVTLSPTEHWISPSGLTVTSEGFNKASPTPTPTNLFLLPGPASSTEAGVGIAGATDHEVDTTNYATFLVTNPGNAFTGTISIDSLQSGPPGEQAEVCAEHTATMVGGTPANCVDTLLGGTVHQVVSLPAAYSAADPWLAVDALSGNVKISDLDTAVTPEPSTLALVVPGMLPFGLAYFRRRATRAKA